MTFIHPCRVIGILNCSPDSFYDGQKSSVEALVEKALLMENQGAEIIDIGGESTRPGSLQVSEIEELSRVLPVIELLRKQSRIPLSIDTSKSKVAQRAIDAGVNMINDVTAGRDPLMPKVAAQNRVEAILMHMQGQPKTMQEAPSYQNILAEVVDFLKERSQIWMDAGVPQQNIIWDPGIGFGKTLGHNLQLMANLQKFKGKHRVLLGSSRKSFIAGIDPYATSPHDRLGGSLASLGWALCSSVDMVRVHDVQETRQFISVFQALQQHHQP